MYKRLSKYLAVLVTFCLISMTCSAALTVYAAENDPMPDFSYIGELGGLSQEEVCTACESIYEQLAKCSPTITVDLNRNLSSTEASAIGDLIFEVSNNFSAGILLDGSKSFSYSYGSYFKATPTYFANGSQQTYSELLDSLDSILAGVHSDWTDVEKALYLHDTIAVDFDYDNEGLAKNNAKHYVYQFLTTNNEAVCDAYASLYCYLLNRINIPCVKIASIPNVHAWNAVKIGEKWYYVDITHDDSYHGYHPGLLTHDYFLNSETDNVNTRNNGGSSWNASQWTLICKQKLSQSNLNISKDDSVDGFWQGIETAITPIGSEWLVANNENPDSKGPYNIKIMNINGDETEIYRNSTGGWDYSYTQGQYIYSGNMPGKYMIPIYYDNVVFFSTGNAIYGLYNNAAATTPVAVATLDNQSNYTLKIYGLKRSGDKLVYYYSTTPTPHFNNSTYEFDNPGIKAEIDLAQCVQAVKSQAANAQKWAANYYISDGAGSFELNTTEYADGFAAPDDIVLYTADNASYCYQSDWYSDTSLTTLFDFSKVLKNDADLYCDYYMCIPMGVYAALDGNIRMNYKFKMNTAVINDDSAKAIFTIKNGEEVRTVEVPFSDAVKTGESDVYELPVEIYSREMDASITLEIVSSHVNYSWDDGNVKCVNDYLNVLKTLSSSSQKVVEMADAALTYGSFADQYFDNTAAQTTESVVLTEEQMNKLNDRKAVYTDPSSDDTGYEYVGSSLILENTTAIRHYFKIADENKMPSVKVDDAEQSFVKKSGTSDLYYVEIKNISADKLNRSYKVNVGTSEMNYSACSYMNVVVSKISGSNTASEKQLILCNAMKAMFLYALAAENMAA